MSTIVQSYDASNNAVYPVTHLRAVRDSSGTTLESMMQDVREMAVGYYECSTPGSTAAKTITTDSSVSLSTKILCKVKFVEKNTANNATMDINGTGAKALYYNGVRTAANNSWYPNEVVDLYYDGTNYQAKSCADTLEYDVSLHQTHEITEITKTTRTLVFNGNVVSSWESETSISDSSVEGYTRSETNTGQDVDSTTVDGPNATYDSSANQTNVVYVTTHTYTHVVNNYTFQEAVNAVPMSYRHGGLKLRFISNSDSSVSDNKYVEYRLMKNTWSTTVSDWQGVDDEPTTGSDNLVKSGGVATDLRNKLVDFSLLSGYTTSESACVNNFKYFICKDSSILQYSPKIGIIYNTEQIPYRVSVSLNNGRFLHFDGIGKKENDYFAFEYDWSKHTNNVNNIYEKSYISVNSSSYAQGLAFLMSKIQTINSNITTISNLIDSLGGSVTTLQNDVTVITKEAYPQNILESSYVSGLYVKYTGHLTKVVQKPYGSYCIPINAGESIFVHFDEQYNGNIYPSMCFTNVLEDNTLCQIIVGSLSGVDTNQIFTAKENGYILIWVYSYTETVKSYINVYSAEISLIKEVLEEGIEEKWLSEEVQEKLNNSISTNGKYPAFRKKIICSGSSITWGTGALDSSMVKYVDKFLKENLSTIVTPEKMNYYGNYNTINNALLYGGEGRMISSLNDSIEFDSYGDEIAICQMKRRSKTDYGIVNVYADDVLIGKFDNKNFIGSETENFSGDDLLVIQLSHPCTFNHIITINGDSTPLSNIVYNTGGYGNTPPSDQSSFDAFVFRALDSNGNPVHRIQFSTALGTINSVSISYDFGNIVAHEKCTVGQTSDEYTNESYYGKGTTSYDPDAPTGGIDSGMEFRVTNEEAFFVHQFTSAKNRHYRIELVGGVNPYFIINYATNRYHILMNAGIGGWSIAALMNNDKINDYTQFFKWFKPDLIFQESETNDDWKYSTRRIKRSIGEISISQLRELPWLEVHTVTYNEQTDKYAVEMCTGIIDSITFTSLVSQNIIGTDTQVGDIIRIGNYHGDIKEVVCRKITEVNLVTGEVKWIEPLSLSEILNVDSINDLIGAEINIRDLSGYKTAYKNYIQKVHEICPESPIVVVNNGLPMLGSRQLWGYDVIHREIVGESSNVKYLDAREFLYIGQFATITGARKETVMPDGRSSYDLNFTGSNKSWYGFKVLVNGVDVYGKGCYIQSQYMYRAKSDLTGSSLNKTNPYTRSNADYSTASANIKMKLVFTKNAPSSNDSVEVWFSDQIWSGDYCHPSEFGGFLYGQAYSSVINQ